MLRKLLAFPIHIYRLVISPWLPRTCRYHPSCSVYALEALARYGVVKGGWLAAARILSCNPWSQRPYDDPVP